MILPSPDLSGLVRPKASPRLEPGLWLRQPGRERYRVPGGGSVTLALMPGDRLTVIDVEGRQPAELLAWLADGSDGLAALGAKSKGAPAGLLALLAGADDSAQALARRIKRQGLRVETAARLFSAEGEAGAEQHLTASAALTVLVAAPGQSMEPQAQDAPSDLLLIVTRAKLTETLGLPLPEPLADPLQDIRIKAGTAQAYLVKAGDYIQVIDVEGRECSDFVCFNRRGLDSGQELIPDTTTTRSLLGVGYPGPGLYSKFFDQTQQALVEVVQDTVGRHDVFGLACTAKYYDDIGYPGHVNCSENMNGALGAHGIAPRKGWPAINFFYNTHISAQNTYYLDEPWSRPGDYVLMRALIDLVCVNTACPDDTTPANGWNPTDIHVRVYSAQETFKKAVAYRMTPDAEPQLTKETGFHPKTSKLTRHLAEYRGFWLPTQFTNEGPIAEYWACREAAIAMDLSALRKFEITGPDAETLMQTALTRDIRKLAVGQVVYSALCYESGGMLDDGTLFRLGPDNFRWIGGDDYGGIWLRELAKKLGLKAWVRNSTDQLHNLSVQGPKSREILKNCIWTPPAQANMDELQWFRFCIGRIGDHNGAPVVVSRTGYTGELGYEIFCHPKDAATVWDAVFEAGRPHGIKPLGLAALDMLRIESGLIFAGYEFNDQTDPFEAGIAFTVPLKSKSDDFIGKAALIKRKESPQRVLVGLEIEGNEVAAHGDCVRIGRQQVGVITSATRSPILKKSIALCRIDIGASAIGTEVEVGKLDGHQKRIPAKVVRFPFYDPEKTRPRS